MSMSSRTANCSTRSSITMIQRKCFACVQAAPYLEQEYLAKYVGVETRRAILYQNEYKRGISGWNFDLEDMKAQASLVSSCQLYRIIFHESLYLETAEKPDTKDKELKKWKWKVKKDHHLHPPPDHRRTTAGPTGPTGPPPAPTTGPPSVHHLNPSAHWTTDAPPPYHRRTTTVSEIRMTLIYEADAEADEEMLTLMSKSSTTSPSDFLSPILVSVTPTFLSQFDSRFTSMAFDPLDGINGGDDCRIVENPNGMSLFDLCEVSVC
ncbi:hypothetical protein LXL04_033347 [Taraxacum kok-saghyz]